MLNLVEKFTPEAVEATDEDGVVAIEYVVMAGAIVVAVVAPRGPALRRRWPTSCGHHRSTRRSAAELTI